MLKIEELIARLRGEEIQKEAAKAKYYGKNDLLAAETGHEATPHPPSSADTPSFMTGMNAKNIIDIIQKTS